MNNPTEEQMRRILDQDLDGMDSRMKEYIAQYLVPIRGKKLKWEYGNEEEYNSWVIADFRERDVGIAYCRGGHGRSGDAWGLISFKDSYFGMDAGWYSSLVELISDGWYTTT